MSAPKPPAGLPPLPDGAVYIPEPKKGFRFDGWGYWEARDAWVSIRGITGKTPGHYAAPADSDIARLNGHGAEPACGPATDSEAVTLVRKLHEQLSKRLDGDEWVWQDAMAVRAEAEAFLKREAGKS